MSMVWWTPRGIGIARHIDHGQFFERLFAVCISIVHFRSPNLGSSVRYAQRAGHSN